MEPSTVDAAMLHQVALLEYLDQDPSPVFVLDSASQTVSYENHAFRQWKATYPAEAALLTLPDRLLSICSSPSGHFDLATSSWRSTIVRKRWIIITGRGLEPAQHGNAAMALASPNLVSEPPLAVGKTLDWTRYNVPGMSAHVMAIKAFPWHTTPVGSIDTWSDTLRTVLITLVANPEPRVLLWGPERIQIYNEACAPLFGIKHPCLGTRGEDTWAEAWQALDLFVSRAETEGVATLITNLPVTMHRHGYDEETFWITNFVPVIGTKGQARAIGVIDEFTETTEPFINNRRRDIVVKINEAFRQISTLAQLWDGLVQGLERAADDVPYAAVYVPTGSTDDNPVGVHTPQAPIPAFSLRGTVGVDPSSSAVVHSFDLNVNSADQHGLVQACQDAWKSGKIVTLQHDQGDLPQCMAISVPGRAAGAQVKTVCGVPVPDLIGNNQLAFVVLAITPRRPFDASAELFVKDIGDVLIRASSTIFLPDEQRRHRQRFEEIETALSLQLRNTSQEAERTEARYETMFSGCPVGMYLIDVDEKLRYFNDAYLVCTGSTRQHALTTKPIDSVHADDRDEMLKLWSSAIQNKKPLTVEYRMQQPWKSVDRITGKEITGETWILASGIPELDEHGNVTQFMAWMLDISERKYHEQFNLERVQDEEAGSRFARLAAECPMGMALIKPDGHPIYFNQAYFDILGLSREHFDRSLAEGRFGWEDQTFEEDAPIVAEAWKKLSVDSLPVNVEYRVKKPWKAYDHATNTEMTGPTWLHATAFPEKDANGNCKSVQAFVSEISLKKFSERLLGERLEEALETKRQADRFIDMTSHEMRNPLSAILQSADGILTAVGVEAGATSLPTEYPSLSAEVVNGVVDAAQTIVLCASHQKRIVDDILTLSKLDSNLLVISPDQVSLPTLVEKCLKMYEGEIVRAKIATAMEIEPGYRDLGIDEVMIDSSRVLQIIINLLTNAVKFTQHAEKREISISLNASTVRPGGSERGKIFVEQRNSLADPTTSPEWGDGEEVFLQVCVRDSGRGLNEEELKLLFHRFSQASPKTYAQYGGSGLGLFISKSLCELQGGQIGVYSEGALKGSSFVFYVKARRAPASATAKTKGSTLSGFQPDSLSTTHPAAVPPRAISPAPQPHTTTTDRNTAQPASASSGLHVLVVEDNEINQRVMATQLRRLGCIVHLASHGLEALAFLETTTASSAAGPDAVPLSVILMDLEMPVLGGLDCVRRIRALQQMGSLTRHVPVIAVTANARSEQMAHAIACGMDLVVTKPFRIPELVPKMEALVARIAAET